MPLNAEDEMSRAWLTVLIAAVVAAVLFIGAVIWVAFKFISFFFVSAHAQEHRHPPKDAAIHERFYKTWMMPDNRHVSCCHDQDCKPAQSRLHNGKWQYRFTDADVWTDIPEPKIERERDSPDGRSHLCARVGYGGFTVLCFAPGSGT